MSKLLLSTPWLAQLEEYERLIVGFSGGLDSTVLLHLLASYSSLRNKLFAVHVNHGISPNALSWQKHCSDFCDNLAIEFFTESVDFDRSTNIEEGARNARYKVFTSLLEADGCLLLGHHLDDQAETLLLQLFRGTGIDGLAAMPESAALGAGSLVRPFLSHTRRQIENYAVNNHLTWITDESNDDTYYSRNFLRQQIIPLLASRWPGVAGNIARTAGHCQQARVNLDELALQDCPELNRTLHSIFIEPVKSLGVDRIANILRVWLKKNQIRLPSTATFQRIIHEVIFAGEDCMPVVSWNNISIRRYQSYLYLDKMKEAILPSSIEWTDFPSPLNLNDTGFVMTAKKADEGLNIPDNARITIKFRQGGERFSWHGQTKQLKKLFQQWGIPPWLRDRIPLLYINEHLAAVAGHAVSDLFFTKNSSTAWKLLINY
ncbi:tRNA lysidine(34) synthetase TilS [uncultured Legionella sp.]|uniref:tRNA lysidine(34) synthetase TilS n=1 Tax=uncultured Legionella sp. TaxID=210934 RepID=UPI0026342A8D|nr:tRNA lysidine(34) synthetase TilS [uncultured Legionella sp.]